MAKVYLCGHTGSVNHGCEAIVRSTKKILLECGINNVSLFTFNKEDDICYGLDKEISLIAYPHKSLYEKVVSVLKRKLFKDGAWGARRLYKKLLRDLDKDSLLFNIGGDTYCYGTPYISYALNEVAEEQGLKNVLWGCSIEDNALEKRI